MAKRKTKRRSKHRGTQTGAIEARGRTSRPRSRAEARQRAQQQRERKRPARGDMPPSWKGTLSRAGLAAGVFLVAVVALFKQPLSAALPVAVLMFALYVPMGFAIDNFAYRRRQRRLAGPAAAAAPPPAAEE